MEITCAMRRYGVLLRRFCLGLLVLLCSWGPLQAASPCPSRPVTVAFYDLGVLYNPQNGNGLDRDVVEALFRRLGCPYTADFQSRVRIWNMLADGQLDMSVSGIPSPERLKFAYFIPYFHVRNQLIYLADTPMPSTPAQALARDDFRLGVVKSYRHGPGWDAWIDELRARGRVEEVADTRILIRLLKGRRITAFPVLPPVLADLGQRYDLDPASVRHTHWFLSQPKIEHGLVLSRQRMPLSAVRAMEQVMAQMRNDGTLLKIYRRYLPEPTAQDMLRP